MSEKWDVREIGAENFRTYVDGRTGKKRKSDYLAFVFFPLVLGLAAALLRHAGHLSLFDVTRLIGGIGIFTGLLFGLLTNVFSLSLRLQRDEDLGDHETSRNVRELFANLAWAVLVGLLLVVMLVVCGSVVAPKDAVPAAWTGVLVAAFAHFILTVLMSLKRLWMAHKKIPHLPPKITQEPR